MQSPLPALAGGPAHGAHGGQALSAQLKPAARINRVRELLAHALERVVRRELEQVHAGGRGGQPALLVGLVDAEGGRDPREAELLR